MLKQIEIGYIRSFSESQTLSFAVPNGVRGSGYNLLLGKNNSGKSMIIKLVRDIFSNQDTITIGQEARHDPTRPILAIDWIRNNQIQRTEIEAHGTGGYFRKIGGDFRNGAGTLKYIPSRRAFASEFQSSHEVNPHDYEQSDYTNRRHNQAYFDNVLSASLARLIAIPEVARRMSEILARIDHRITGLDADNVGGRDVIRFQSASGRWHVVSDTGDGVINVIRIVHAIMSSVEGFCIIVDEPELSLHPQLQRNLYDLLIDVSATHQVIVVSHSPHFISWRDVAEQGRLFRLYLDENGWSQVRAARRERLAEVRQSAVANVTNRKYYDAVCKELFFSDQAVLVEGPDDVHYISNYLETTQSAPLPLMGYGCGGAGNIRPWMRLCKELGIKSAALYDGDKFDEFDASVEEFANENEFPVGSFLLPRDDIRDKHRRDENGRESADVLKAGIFRRNGTIHEDAQEMFELLLRSIRTFLC